MRLVERLMTVDKVDIVLSPWGTGPNLQAAPIFAKYGYPQLMGTAGSRQDPGAGAEASHHVLVPGHARAISAKALVELAGRPEAEGQNQRQGGPVRGAASVRVGVQRPRPNRCWKRPASSSSTRPPIPLGVSDLSAQIKAAKAAAPDTMIAFSYPPDTFMLTEQSIANDFNPKVKFLGVGVAFPNYKGKFGDKVNGTFGLGAWNPNGPGMQGLVRAPQGPDTRPGAGSLGELQHLRRAAGRCSRRSSRSARSTDPRSSRPSRPAPSRPSSATPSSTPASRKVWWVGQWQDGEFYGIAPTDLPGASTAASKVAWTLTTAQAAAPRGAFMTRAHFSH